MNPERFGDIYARWMATPRRGVAAMLPTPTKPRKEM